MARTVLFGTALALLVLAIVSSGSAKPADPELAQTSTTTSTASSTSTGSSADGGSSTTTVAPDASGMSKFFDDFSSAFKSGTAKVKESLESAATSVKDGVLRGYGFVKDKLTGAASGDSTTPSSANETVSGASTTTTTTSAVTAESARTVSGGRSLGTSATAKAIGMEPNDEEAKDDDRLIFIGDEDMGTDSPVAAPTTTTPKIESSSVAGNKTQLDDRFIIDGPLACKANQKVVEGKCRNVF